MPSPTSLRRYVTLSPYRGDCVCCRYSREVSAHSGVSGGDKGGVKGGVSPTWTCGRTPEETRGDDVVIETSSMTALGDAALESMIEWYVCDVCATSADGGRCSPSCAEAHGCKGADFIDFEGCLTHISASRAVPALHPRTRHHPDTFSILGRCRFRWRMP